MAGLQGSPFNLPQPQPNASNQSAYTTAASNFSAAITNLTAVLPGLYQAWISELIIAMGPVNDPSGVSQSNLSNAKLALNAAKHALDFDVLTYHNMLQGWYDTWYFNTIAATEPPPTLPPSLAAYAPKN